MNKILITFCIFFTLTSLGRDTYEDLKVKDYEQMRVIIDSHIRKTQNLFPEKKEKSSKKDYSDPDQAIYELKKALKILFMRPDTDGLRSSLLIPLKAEINIYKPFINVLEEIIKESIPILKSKKSSAVSQAGSLYILENSISYAKGNSNSKTNEIFKNLRDEKIKLSDSLVNHLRLNEGRGKTASPSHIAGKILEKRIKKQKLLEKKKKKEKALKKK